VSNSLRVVAVITSALALVVAGCGGGGTSKEDWAKNAEKVCNDLKNDFNNIQRPTSPAQIDRFTSQLTTKLDEGVTRLKDIKRPSGSDGDKAKAFVDAVENAANQIKPALSDLKKAIAKRDVAAIRQIGQRVQSLNSGQIDRLAREAGANGCAG
jgi:hypothetical protein